MSNKNESNQKYYLFNCENFPLGRMSSRITSFLQGKNTPRYSSNKIGDPIVIVTNCDKLKVSGRKREAKMYHSFSGYPGGIRSKTLADLISEDSRKVVWESVYGMLPKNKLRDLMMKKIIFCKDENHGITSKQIEELRS